MAFENIGVDLTAYEVVTYPAAAAAATVTTSGTAWAWAANYTELIPVNTITTPYYVEAIVFSASDIGQAYQIKIGHGGAGAEVSDVIVPIHNTAGIQASHDIPVGPTLIPANARLAFNATDSENAANVASVYVRIRKAR